MVSQVLRHTIFLIGNVTDPSERVFTFLPYESLFDVSDPGYQPRFEVEPSPEAAMCDGDPFCVFDLNVTGSQVFGAETLGAVAEANQTEELVAAGPGETGVKGHVLLFLSSLKFYLFFNTFRFCGLAF